MDKLYRYFLLLILFVPGLVYSQDPLEGGFVDNTASDMITRLSVKDKPISDMMEFNGGLITYTDGSLYFYNVQQEEAQALIYIGHADAKFVDLQISSTDSLLFLNTYDASGAFQTALAYDLSNNSVIDMGAVELKDVYLVRDKIYFIGKESSSVDFGLYYHDQTTLGKMDGLDFGDNYQVEISSTGTLWFLANNLLQGNILYYITATTTEYDKLNNFAQTNDVSFALINDNVYYSSGAKIIKVDVNRDKTELGDYEGEKFFKLGANYIGFYVPSTLTSNDVKIAGADDVVSSLSLGTFLDADLQRVLQVSDNYAAMVNGINEVLVVNSSSELVNQGSLFSFNDNTPFYGKVFDGRYLTLYSSESVLGSTKSDKLLYYDLDQKKILAERKFDDYQEEGYDFRPKFSSAAGKEFVVAFDQSSGFEINLLSEASSDGFLVAEEVTNDDFSKQFLSDQGVEEVLEEYSTYPKRLISLNNTLYYLGHLASGTYAGYYFLHKVNEYPTAISLSNNTVSEAISSATVVATLSGMDADDTQFAYDLVTGAGDTDNSLFSIVGEELNTGGGFDYESESSLSIRIRATDPHGLSHEQSITINVEDANDAPEDILLNATSVLEGADTGTKVADISTSDQDVGDSFTYSLPNSASDSFKITGSELFSNVVFDYSIQSEYTITIRTEDAAGASFEKSFTINILETNLQPNDISLSNTVVPENAATNEIIGQLSTTDPNETDTNFTYALVDGSGSEDKASFSIDNAADPAVLKTSAVFDYEVKNSFNIRIQTTDAAGATFEKPFTITVTDVNDPPNDIGLSNTYILENEPKDTKIADISTSDQDASDSFTYSLPNSASDSFQITGSELFSNAVFDYSAQSKYTITMRTQDAAGEALLEDFTINILENSQGPRDISLSNNVVSENLEENPNGLVVGQLSTDDPSGEIHTYSLEPVDTLDNSLFKIVEVNKLAFKSFDNISYEKDSIYHVNLKTANDEGSSTTKSFNIYIREYIDIEPPAIVHSTAENTIVSSVGNTTITVNATVSDWELNTVSYKYAGVLTQTFSEAIRLNYTEGDSQIEIPISEDKFDEFGIKLQIQATDKSGNLASSEIFYFYRELAESNIYDSLPEANLGRGRLSTDYKMLSIPYELDNKEIKSFMEQQLGVIYSVEDRENFRVWHWSSDKYIGIPTLSKFKAGESYWFTTTVEDPEINFGSGKLWEYKESHPFVWQLKQGWNQIGNPYPVALDWNNVTQGTELEGSVLHVYDGAFQESNTIEPYEGAFVLVEKDVELKATLENKNTERKIADLPFTWKVDFEVQQSDFSNTGRIAMHPQASFALDKFDVANPPSFQEHLEINLNKEERFYSNYKNDVVNNQNTFEWDLSINSHQNGTPVTLKWNVEGVLPKQLFLIDMNSLVMTDMATTNEYYFTSEGKPEFKVVYRQYSGSKINLGTLLIGKPYPNPMTDLTTIGINLPESNEQFKISAEIIDLNGRNIRQLQYGSTYESGFHRLQWNGLNNAGEQTASGIYIYNITVSGSTKQVFTGRIIKMN